MANKPESTPETDASRRPRPDDETELEIEVGPDGPALVDPLAPGKSLFDEDENAVEPNEPA